MEKAQVIGFFFIAVCSVLLMSNLVSANKITDDINKGIDGVVGVFKPIFEQILGKDENATDAVNTKYFFARVLLLIMIFAILWAVLGGIGFFQDKTGVLVVVSAVISILAMRGIATQGLIETILLPTETLGIALTAGIPFVVYFAIVEFNNLGWPRPARNAAWILFGVIFIGLWISRYEVLADTVTDSAAFWIYPITAVLAFSMMLFDGTIQRWRAKIFAGKASAESAKEQIKDLKRQLRQAHEDFVKGGVYGSKADYLREVNDLNDMITTINSTI